MLNFGGLLPGKGMAPGLRSTIDGMDMVNTIFWIIAVPLVLGLVLNNKFPRQAELFYKPLRFVSLAILPVIIALAFAKNYTLFLRYYHYIIILVFVHNSLALLGGYYFGRLMKNTERIFVLLPLRRVFKIPV